jgi:hypothetical protein
MDFMVRTATILKNLIKIYPASSCIEASSPIDWTVEPVPVEAMAITSG